MQTALADSGSKTELVLYADTPHAFFADYRPNYRKEQADDGWKRILDWRKQHGL